MTTYDSILKHLGNPSLRHFKRREIIYHEGDYPEAVYLIQKGLVGLFHISETGKESFLRVFGERSILGHRTSIAGGTYHASSVSLEQSSLYIIPLDQWDKLLKQEEINSSIMKRLAKDLAEAELRLANQVDKPAKNRIVETLIYLKLKHPDHIFTRKEIADYSGSTMETTARVMSELESVALLTKDGRDYIIPDPEKALEYFSDNT